MAARWDPERWREIDAFFQAAVARPPDERQAFLDEACGDDPELRAEVERLLAADEGGTELLDAPVRAAAVSVLEDPAGSLAGQRIGPYRLFRELGRGGMGAVYLAGRADDEFRRQVTVKVIKPGMDSEGIVRRFRNERQILASLDHPNVARLLDGGSTDSGQPYLVMEHVEGEPIDEYCDHHRLSIEERLELFCKVCSAVQSAHQNLVVHRDLKPGNVLVTATGEPKLLDFGVAKLLNPEMAGQTVAATGIDQWRLMTPEYASPEQVRGGPITTASDVYSLGVLLYELLTGHRPYRFANRLPQEIERVVCDTEPEKPSTAVGHEEDTGTGETVAPETLSALRGGRPDGLRRKLSGDLDNIVLMAMRKEPQRRYVSAAQLADDVRRHLEGLPVIARPATFGYRAGKFVRRHALGVTFVVSLAVFAAVMTVQSVRVARERDKAELAQAGAEKERSRAELEKARAEEISKFLVGIFELADPNKSQGQEITAREVLDQAAERIEREFPGQPLLKATLMHTMARTYFGLGEYQSALEFSEKSLALRRTEHGKEHLDVAESLVMKGRALAGRGDAEGAKAAFGEALEIRRKLLNGRDDVRLIESLNRLASILVAMEAKMDHDRARPLLRESQAMIQRLMYLDTPELAGHLSDLGTITMRLGDYDTAEPLLLQALEMRKRLLGDRHIHFAQTLNNLAVLYFRQGSLQKALPRFQELGPIVRQVYGKEHPVYALTLRNEAFALQVLKFYDRSEATYRESLAVFQGKFGERNSHVAVTKSELAALLTEMDRFAEARELIGEALDFFRTTPESEDWRIRYAESTSAACLIDLRRYREAEPLLVESHRALVEHHGEGSPYVQLTVKRLVTLYQAWGKPDRAAEYRALLSEPDGPG